MTLWLYVLKRFGEPPARREGDTAKEFSRRYAMLVTGRALLIAWFNLVFLAVGVYDISFPSSVIFAVLSAICWFAGMPLYKRGKGMSLWQSIQARRRAFNGT